MIIFRPGIDPLPLLAESLALLPPESPLERVVLHLLQQVASGD